MMTKLLEQARISMSKPAAPPAELEKALAGVARIVREPRPVYRRAADYDAVLRWHCRQDGEG